MAPSTSGVCDQLLIARGLGWAGAGERVALLHFELI